MVTWKNLHMAIFMEISQGEFLKENPVVISCRIPESLKKILMESLEESLKKFQRFLHRLFQGVIQQKLYRYHCRDVSKPFSSDFTRTIPTPDVL